jgi:hypothetical protein
MDLPPLGDYEQLGGSHPRPWASGTVVHGSGVLDDLVAGIARHRDGSTQHYWARLAQARRQSAAFPG